MPRKSAILQCAAEDKKTLERMARSRTGEARLVERARIVLGLLKGDSVSAVARTLKVRPNTVIDWRRRFETQGIAGLRDRPRSGKPVRYDAEFRNQVLKVLELDPPSGQSCWDGPAVARRLKASPHAVWRLLRKEGICLSRNAVGVSAPILNSRRRPPTLWAFT